MQIESHYVILVYPFFHRFAGADRASGLRDVEGWWISWWNRLAVDAQNNTNDSLQRNADLERAIDDTYFFLPHIRQLLFPETELLPRSELSDQLSAAVDLLEVPLHDLAAKLAPYGVLRLTYPLSKVKALHPLELVSEHKNEQGDIIEHFNSRISVDWIDVALMPQQIGFLSLKLHLDHAKTDVSFLNDFLYYVRQIHKPTVDWQLPIWKHLDSQFTSRDLVDFLLQGLTETESSSSSIMSDLGDWMSKRNGIERYSLTDQGQVYGQTFRLYSYVGLAETKGQTKKTTQLDNTISVVDDDERPQFESDTDKTLYELATCTRTDEMDYMPHSIALKEVMEKGRIAFWTNWQAMALHDNVVFLATTPTPFTRNVFPHNVEFDYFHLYLLTLYQKTRLSVFSAELMRHEGSLLENLNEARKLWEAFTMFRNHYWFAEVTFKPQGTALYQRFQAGLNATPLYNAVSNEVSELQGYYERKSDQQMADLTMKLQEGMAKNVELTRTLQESTNAAVIAAKDVADRQLTLSTVMQQNLAATNQLQTDMNTQLKIVANIQVKVEWIEIFVVAFYTAELVHIIIELFEKSYHFELWWSSTLVLGSGLLAALIAWFLLRPDRHSESDNRLAENRAKA